MNFDLQVLDDLAEESESTTGVSDPLGQGRKIKSTSSICPQCLEPGLSHRLISLSYLNKPFQVRFTPGVAGQAGDVCPIENHDHLPLAAERMNPIKLRIPYDNLRAYYQSPCFS